MDWVNSWMDEWIHGVWLRSLMGVHPCNLKTLRRCLAACSAYLVVFVAARGWVTSGSIIRSWCPVDVLRLWWVIIITGRNWNSGCSAWPISITVQHHQPTGSHTHGSYVWQESTLLQRFMRRSEVLCRWLRWSCFAPEPNNPSTPRPSFYGVNNVLLPPLFKRGVSAEPCRAHKCVTFNVMLLSGLHWTT